MTIDDEIKQRMRCYLCQSPTLSDTSEPTNPGMPMFGYDNPGNNESIQGILGIYHGQQYSQFQLLLHLLPSQSRQDKDDKVDGLLNIPFSTIQCSKENARIEC